MSKPDRESVLPPAVVEAVTREVQRRAEIMDSPFWGPLIRQSMAKDDEEDA